MSQFISVQLDDQTKIYFETIDVYATKKDPMLEEASSSKWVLEQSKEYLDNVLSQVRKFSSSIANSIRNISDEVEINFSVKLTADAGIIISSVSTGADISVKLKWDKD